MPRLPDADGRAIFLNLIDVSSLNPDILRLLDGLLYNYGLGDNRLLNHNGLLHDRWGRHDRWRRLNHNRFRVVRTSQRRSYHTANDSADEARPEVTTSAPPIAAVMVVTAMPAMMNRRRVMESSMMRSAMSATRESPSRYRHKSDCNYEFFHLICPFLSV